MIKRYYFTLLLISLFALAPLHGMETEPTQEQLKEFYHAVREHDLDTVKAMLNGKINFEDRHKTGALTSAIRHILLENHEDTELLQILLQSGFKPEKTHLFYGNLLSSISKHRNQIAHLLLSHGVTIDSDDNTPYKKEDDNLLRYYEAVNMGNLSELINIVKAHINTHLLIAIKDGNMPKMCRLIKKYDIDINTSLPYYFHECTNYGTPKVLLGEDYNTSTMISPLHQAVCFNKYEIVQHLINKLGADVNLRTITNATALHFSTTEEIANFLISKGSDLDATDSNGKKPKDFNKHLDPLNAKRNTPSGASATVPNISVNNPPIVENNKTSSAMETNKTQFYDALKQGDLRTAKNMIKTNTKLIEDEINPDTNPAERQALKMILLNDVASDKDKKEVIFLLLNHGIKPEYEHLFDALIIIDDSIEKITPKEQILHAFLACGAPLDIGGDNNYATDACTQCSADSLLQYLSTQIDNQSISGNPIVFSLMVKKHINTRLLIAIGKEDIHEIRRLIKKYNIDINKPLSHYVINRFFGYNSHILEEEKNYLNITPLHYAVIHSKDNIIRLLVNELGANANNKDLLGKTVFSYDMVPLSIETATFLLDHGAPCPTESLDTIISDHMSTHQILTSDKENHLQNLYCLFSERRKSQNNQNYPHSFQKMKDITDLQKEKALMHEPQINPDDLSDADNTSSEEDTSNLKPTPQQNPQQINNNPQKPVTVEPDNDPIKNQTNVIAKSVLPWKLIGGGVVIVAAIVAGKKLYNWYYAKTEQEDIESETEETNASAENAATA